ncbi:hypothetical protein PPROV_000622800 [Pycnococcus provasolii]|uniref:Sulfhydryl oxidase n=1 Tax=Pycnococcus provasolii TaxID=41880 RepID=A0A830HJD1_9CHLO|nr:hypothetical protein PPROV_000622800 [Pycnococcus provasolii]
MFMDSPMVVTTPMTTSMPSSSLLRLRAVPLGAVFLFCAVMLFGLGPGGGGASIGMGDGIGMVGAAATRLGPMGGGGGGGHSKEVDADGMPLAAHAALQAAEATFEAVLVSLTKGTDDSEEEGPHVLMELYASWCPHCRHYAPEYDVIARAINFNIDSAKRVHVLRVDCAHNNALCEKYEISGYPSIVFGTVSAVKRVGMGEVRFSQQKDAILVKERKPGAVIKFVNGKLGTAFSEETANSAASSTAAPTPRAVTLRGGGEAQGIPTTQTMSVALRRQAADTRDAELATVMMSSLIFGHTAASASKLPPLPAANRQPLLKWYGVLARHHPVTACRSGAKSVVNAIYTHWVDGQEGRPDHLAAVPVCGAGGAKMPEHHSQFPDDAWQDCRGTTEGGRGFTCGLWQLFHAVAVDAAVKQLDDGKALMEALDAYVRNFFGCQVCRDHFLTLIASAQVRTARDFALWLWRSHNVVNDRLAAEEAEGGDGDPSFPKVTWPGRMQCPACYKDDTWNEDAVLAFLIRYYAGAAEADPSTTIKSPSPSARAAFSDYGGGGGGRSDSLADGTSNHAMYVGGSVLVAIGLVAWCVRTRGPTRARAWTKHRLSLLPSSYHVGVGLAKAL